MKRLGILGALSATLFVTSMTLASPAEAASRRVVECFNASGACPTKP